MEVSDHGILSLHLPAKLGTEENNENPVGVVGRDSKQAQLKYKSEGSPLIPTSPSLQGSTETVS
jgi:hypothetical protein